MSLIDFIKANPDKTDAEVLMDRNVRNVLLRTTYWLTYGKLTVDFGIDAARAMASVVNFLSQFDPLVGKFDTSLCNDGVDLSLDLTQTTVSAMVNSVPDDNPAKAAMLELLPDLLAKGQRYVSAAEVDTGRSETQADVDTARATIAERERASQISALRNTWMSVHGDVLERINAYTLATFDEIKTFVNGR